MNRRKKLAIGAGLIMCAAVGLAVATAPTKLAPTLFALGTSNSEIEVMGAFPVGDDQFHVHLMTNGPSNVGIQEAAFQPGGAIGWHSHAGLVIVQMVSGSVEWYDQYCNKTVYNAGDAWVEGSQPHYFRNVGTVNAQVLATVIVSKGAGLRVDQPAPACAVALGLN